jgi:hypothetical protein
MKILIVIFVLVDLVCSNNETTPVTVNIASASASASATTEVSNLPVHISVSVIYDDMSTIVDITPEPEDATSQLANDDTLSAATPSGTDNSSLSNSTLPDSTPILKLIDIGDSLIITPLFDDQTMAVTDIQAKALITASIFEDFPAYSGFFTVNSTYSSNLFFAYVPADMDTPTKPLTVYLTGGGVSSLHAFFLENGPVSVDSANNVIFNMYSWHLSSHMLFLDTQVGVGFSFAQDPLGYPTNMTRVTSELYGALRQFLQLFPDLQSREVFICGQSFSAKYSAALASLIVDQNPTAPYTINLKGIMLGNSLWDPIVQMGFYASNFNRLGLQSNYDAFVMSFTQYLAQQYVYYKLDSNAFTTFSNMLSTFYSSKELADGYFNYITKMNLKSHTILGPLMEDPDWKSGLHVGLHVPFVNKPYASLDSFNNQFESAKLAVLSLLSKEYRILFYNSGSDILIPPTANSWALYWAYYYRDWYPYFVQTQSFNLQIDGKSVGSVKSCEYNFLYIIIYSYPLLFVISDGVLTELSLKELGHIATNENPELMYRIFDKFACNRKF